MRISDQSIHQILSLPEHKKSNSGKTCPPASALPCVEPLTKKSEGFVEPKPYRILQNIRKISTNTHRNAAIDKHDSLWTWGAVSMASYTDNNVLVDDGKKKYYSNDVHFTNDISQETLYIPMKVIGNISSVSAGEWHYMCVTNEGKLYGWGENKHGELGLGDYENRYTPCLIRESVRSVSSGSGSTYFSTDSDRLYRCGKQVIINHNDVVVRKDSTPVFFLSDIVILSASATVYLAINSRGELFGWGDNTMGIIYSKQTRAFYNSPVHIADDVKSVSMSPFGGYGFVQDHSGGLYAIGVSGYGSSISYKDRKKHGFSPIKILENVAGVSTGNNFTLVWLNDGRLFSFGENWAGQCGTGKVTPPIKKPRLIMENVIEAAAGHFHGTALQENGDLWIWGGDYGVSV